MGQHYSKWFIYDENCLEAQSNLRDCGNKSPGCDDGGARWEMRKWVDEDPANNIASAVKWFGSGWCIYYWKATGGAFRLDKAGASLGHLVVHRMEFEHIDDIATEDGIIEQPYH